MATTPGEHPNPAPDRPDQGPGQGEPGLPDTTPPPDCVTPPKPALPENLPD